MSEKHSAPTTESPTTAAVFLPELAKLNASYYQLLLSKQTAEQVAQNFPQMQDDVS